MGKIDILISDDQTHFVNYQGYDVINIVGSVVIARGLVTTAKYF